MKLTYSKVSEDVLDVKLDKRTEVFNQGKDNAFPSLIEALSGSSVTAKTCIDRVTKAIFGGGFGEAGKRKVNSKGQTLNEVLRIAAREFAKHTNVYLQVGFNANFKVKSIVVVTNKAARVGKDDDKGYSGKFIIYDNWDKSKGKKIMSESFEIIDRYNPKKNIVEGQIEKIRIDKKLESIEDAVPHYNGQLAHLKKEDSYIYSMSDLTPVLGDCLTEINSQRFRANGSEDAFLNVKVIATQPMKNPSERNDFRDSLNGVRGAKNSSGVVWLEASQHTDDLAKQLFISDLTGEYNDKIFESSEKRSQENIANALQVPLMLIVQSDNSIFGASGSALEQAEKKLFERREEERLQLEELFSDIMKRFHKDPIKEGLEIINPYEEAEEEVSEGEPEDVNAKAQATLRGSVGGVTALLAIQTSVAAGTTTKEAGVSMIVNLFGFEEETAVAMLGEPKKIDESLNTE